MELEEKIKKGEFGFLSNEQGSFFLAIDNADNRTFMIELGKAIGQSPCYLIQNDGQLNKIVDELSELGWDLYDNQDERGLILRMENFAYKMKQHWQFDYVDVFYPKAGVFFNLISKVRREILIIDANDKTMALVKKKHPNIVDVKTPVMNRIPLMELKMDGRFNLVRM